MAMDIFKGMEIFKRKQATQEATRQEICFFLNRQEFGIDIFSVQEIIFPTAISSVPMTPPFVEGILNLRGKIIPVIDLRKRMNLPEADKTESTRIIVVDQHNKKIGLIVDAVSEVFKIPASQIESPDEIAGSWLNREFITGAAKLDGRLIVLLNLETLINSYGLEGSESPALAIRSLQETAESAQGA